MRPGKLFNVLFSVLTAAALTVCSLAVPSFAAKKADDPNVYKGHTYKVFNTVKTWTQAKSYCESLGGHLVTISTEEEQLFVQGLARLEEKSSYWIGLSKSSGTPKWTDGKSLSFTNFDFASETSSQSALYASMYSRTVTYDAWECSEGMWAYTSDNASVSAHSSDIKLNNFGFICEWDSKKTLKNASSDTTFTIMLYLDGADLEPRFGECTTKIKQLMKSFSGKNVNIIFETGGTYKWKYKNISTLYDQRWLVQEKKVKLVDNTVGRKNMGSSGTLSSFINYCKKNYPADRYALILSDHGGAINGICADYNHGRDALSLEELRNALRAGGVHFDFIGTDACIMANIETVLAVSDYTDFFVGSENPSYVPGWQYTNWVSSLCADPSLKTETICKMISDDYCDYMRKKGRITGVSVIDTRKVINGVLPALNRFCSEAENKLNPTSFPALASAKFHSEVIDADDFWLVDLKQFCTLVNTPSSSSLLTALDDAIVYANKTKLGDTMRGMSITLPSDPNGVKRVNYVLSVYQKLGKNTGSYTSFLKHYANVIAGAAQYYTGNDASAIYKNAAWINRRQFFSDEDYSKIILSKRDEDIPSPVSGGNPHVSSDIINSDLVIESGINVWLAGTDNIARYELGNDNVIRSDGSGYILNTGSRWICLNNEVIPIFYISTETFKGGKTHNYRSVCVINNKISLLFFTRTVYDGKNTDEWELTGYSSYDSSGKISSVKSPVYYGLKVTFVYEAVNKNGEDDILFSDPMVLNTNNKISYNDLTYKLRGTHMISRIYVTDIFGLNHYSGFAEYDPQQNFIKMVS